MQVDAVVLSGGTLKGWEGPKGFLKLGDKSMVEMVIKALKEAPSVRNIVVVVPFSDISKWEKRFGTQVVYSDGDLLSNLEVGLKMLKESDLVLIVSGDIPLITAEAVEDFLFRCSQVPADGYYPIISKEWVQRKFPQTKRTYATLREGTFTGGNFILVRPQVILSNWSWVKKFYEGRKSPFQQASFLGLSVILGFLTKTLTIRKAEERLSKLIGANLKAVITPYPEIGTDVDKEEDIQLMKEILGGGSV